MSTVRSSLYRGICRSLERTPLLSWVAGQKRVQEQARLAFWDRNPTRQIAKTEDTVRVWFHASSYGELEMLWPVAEGLLSERPDQAQEWIVTVFSESAYQRVKDFAAGIESQFPNRVKLLHLGYCPWEGAWSRALAALSPDLLITARYEAWPELWVSLSEQKIPLWIVGARPRKSLKTAARVCQALGQSLPSLVLLGTDQQDVSDLRVMFPEARIEVGGDPRWDRVASRNARGNIRAKELVQKCRGAPRPWIILGNAWIEDLEMWKSVLDHGFQGTLWIAPHQLNVDHLAAMRSWLADRQWKAWSTRSGESAPIAWEKTLVFVDEMGFLSELYSEADGAFVGGGFGKSVHNTIEPAIHGIPIAIGPARSDAFSEIGILKSTGQLEILRSSTEIAAWARSVLSKDLGQSLEKWRGEAKERLGAGRRIAAQILKAIETC